jgi:Tol biopolymer transport system component
MRIVKDFALLLFATISAAGCATSASSQSSLSAPYSSRDQVISITLSPDGKELAFVTLSKGSNALHVMGKGGASREVANDPLIRNVQFTDDHRIVYATKGSIRLYDMRTSECVRLASGTTPIGFYGRSRLLYLEENSVRFLDLATGENRRVTSGDVLLMPCDWTDDASFLACNDGHLWKVGLDGSRERLLEGSRYSPRYVAARLSPDRRRALVVSDDTNVNVGAGSRSVWRLNLSDRKAQPLFSGAPNAQWLDSQRIVMLSGNKLVAMDVDTKTQTDVAGCRDVIESFDCQAGQIVYATRELDEDGLCKGSSLYRISSER